MNDNMMFEDDDSFSNQEFREWIIRHDKIRIIVSTMTDQQLLECNYLITQILVDYFADFPAIKVILDGNKPIKHTYPILIPVTEDVLRQMGLFND